jgi:hypothetical protein
MIFICGARADPLSAGPRDGVVGTSAVSAALMLGAKNVVYSMFSLEREAFYAIHSV